ncbi:MAG TPA: hypothetical protein PKL85_11400, partial [Bacteroidia bacterium]|nr:hypothetical protein [Bacteroidia bacterium]
QVANKIWWIENAEVKEYPGDYEEYEYSRSQQKAANQAIQKAAAAQAKAKKQEIAEKKKNDPSEEEKKRKKKLSSRVQQLETELVKLREEREAMEKHLSKPEVYGDPKSFQEQLQKFNALEEKLKGVNSEWEKTFEELSEME